MKYTFNFENREKPIQFNREKLLLSALQEAEQLYYMMDTQYEGIYQAEAVERKRLYGSNSFKQLLRQSRYKFLSQKKQLINERFELLERQKSSVFRKGVHFYSEIDFEDIVPGDVVFLSRGDVVPSDIRIVFSKDLVVDQSLYAGGEQYVKKISNYNEQQPVVQENIIEIPDICFTASLVVGGLARGVVVSTGGATYLGNLLQM